MALYELDGGAAGSGVVAVDMPRPAGDASGKTPAAEPASWCGAILASHQHWRRTNIQDASVLHADLASRWWWVGARHRGGTRSCCMAAPLETSR